MRPRPWFDRWPAFLERQCRALEDAGIPYRIDADLRARGVLVLEVTPTVDGQVLRLIVAFPATFPYTRFEIHAPTLDLKHHQHPFSKTLCFIGRPTRNWHESDMVADYLRQRLPRVLRAGQSEDRTEVEGIEEPQAEPFSDYYAHSCEKDAIVLLGAAPALDRADARGELVIGIPDDMGGVLRGAVVAIKDMTGKVLSEADPALTRLCSRQLRGRWVRLQSPIREADPERFYWALVGAHPELARPEWRGVRSWKIDIVGVVSPDEVGWREAGDGWIFLVRGEELKDPGRKKTKKYLVRGALAGRSDLAARVPELRALAERKIALIGLGGIGGPSALEFARAGIGDLRILDGDIIDPGTAVRWPFGFGVAGLRKTDVIKDFVQEQYPYVRVRAWHRRLGTIAMDRPSDLEILDEVLDGVSLIYDATAEVGIQHLLADLARERGVPYVCVSSTAGAWGGLLIRLRPKETEGCWVCSQWALQDKTIPDPPADPKAGVQPAGCADPTFTGSSFDLAQVSSAGVRLAVGTVLAGTADAYPDVAWDVAVISLRERGGQIIVPRVETFPLRRHPSCKCGDG